MKENEAAWKTLQPVGTPAGSRFPFPFDLTSHKRVFHSQSITL